MIRFELIWILGMLGILATQATAGEERTQTEWGRPQVEVKQEEDFWIIRGQRLRISLQSSNLSIQVKDSDTTWSMEGSTAGDLTVGTGGQTIALRMADAKKIEINPYETGFKAGVKIRLSEYLHQDKPIDLRVELFLCLQGRDEDLVCELIADEDKTAVKECRWPGAFVPSEVDATVVPYMQGMLLPKDWSKQVYLYDTLCFGRGLYMPWWGYQKGGSAAMVILETPVDGGCHFAHPAGGPTRMGTRWVHSLGKMAYPRRARVCFVGKGNYIMLAKRYRQQAMDTGNFVSLKEKIARNPIVERLIGSPVIHTGTLVHIQPESSYFNKEDPSKNHSVIRFEETARQLRELAKSGVSKAYVHLDGWGFRGYDNLHPDILPPCPEAGGWEGLKGLAQTCEEIGFIFALHDQYRDYYLDAKSYQERHTILDENGNRPLWSIWCGGKQTVLCSSLAPGHVAKNYSEILSHGVKVCGAYLDVFSVVPPDECYHPEHPVTRAQCLLNRGDCFDFIRARVGVISSEEPSDWAIPHLDLVHHGPFALSPGPGEGPAMGIPIPLFNLVYHDALLIPWSLGKGAWGIPENDRGYLHGLANAGMPYLSMSPGPEEIKQVRTMCGLHQRLALVEMTDHRFLDEGKRRQQTSFADGTKVTIDLDKDSFEISPSS